MEGRKYITPNTRKSKKVLQHATDYFYQDCTNYDTIYDDILIDDLECAFDKRLIIHDDIDDIDEGNKKQCQNLNLDIGFERILKLESLKPLSYVKADEHEPIIAEYSTHESTSDLMYRDDICVIQVDEIDYVTSKCNRVKKYTKKHHNFEKWTTKTIHKLK